MLITQHFAAISRHNYKRFTETYFRCTSPVFTCFNSGPGSSFSSFISRAIYLHTHITCRPEHLLNVTRAPPLKQLHLRWTLDDTWYIRESKVCLWWSSEISLLHYNPSKYSHCCRLSWFSLTSVFSSAKPKTQLSSHLHYHNCRCQPTPTSTTVFFHVYVSLRRQKIHSSSANANFRLFSKVFQHNTLTSVSIL